MIPFYVLDGYHGHSVYHAFEFYFVFLMEGVEGRGCWVLRRMRWLRRLCLLVRGDVLSSHVGLNVDDGALHDSFSLPFLALILFGFL